MIVTALGLMEAWGEVIAPDFVERYVESSRAEAPLMAFLARAPRVSWWWRPSQAHVKALVMPNPI